MKPAEQLRSGRQGDGASQSGLVGDHLVFLLGLAPILIAMMRVFLMAQGDYGTLMVLIRTLDIRTLITATLDRSIGLFVAGATAYVITVTLWRPEDDRGAPGDRTVLGPNRRAALPFLCLVFVMSFLLLYPEQLF